MPKAQASGIPGSRSGTGLQDLTNPLPGSENGKQANSSRVCSLLAKSLLIYNWVSTPGEAPRPGQVTPVGDFSEAWPGWAEPGLTAVVAEWVVRRISSGSIKGSHTRSRARLGWEDSRSGDSSLSCLEVTLVFVLPQGHLRNILPSTKMFLDSEGNHRENKKTTERMGEDVCLWNI